MSPTPPIITFRSSVSTPASPDAIYAVLADLGTHLLWAGEQAPDKNFRLLSLEAPLAAATVGDRFSSRGANGFSMTFVDTSVVVAADRGTRFGFDTESKLERKHRPAWSARFAHRYSIAPEGAGATVTYTCEVWPQNYVPWWLHPLFRPMTRAMVPRAIRKNLENLVGMAAAAAEHQRNGKAG